MATAPAVSIQLLAREKFIFYPETKEHCIQDFQKQILANCQFDYTLLRTKSSLSFYQQLVSMKKGVLLYPTKLTNLPIGCVQKPLVDVVSPTQYSLFFSRHASKAVIDFASEILEFMTRTWV